MVGRVRMFFSVCSRFGQVGRNIDRKIQCGLFGLLFIDGRGQ